MPSELGSKKAATFSNGNQQVALGQKDGMGI